MDIRIMKFTLTYDGDLRSNDDYRRKWAIRSQLHPQLRELWEINPALRSVMRQRYVPAKGGWLFWASHHEEDQEGSGPKEPEMADLGETRDLCEPMTVKGRQFFPLVRNSLALRCGLKIMFLRKEPPGRVYQGGDIDNRLKTLFDALSMPKPEQMMEDASIEDPIYCLLEDDGLISKLEVETHQLLSRPNASKHEVHLVIEVDVRVIDSRAYNQAFLGD
jgi:hypothetical protein